MYISPMLLQSTDRPFNDPAFIFEPKIDGHRLILSHKNNETRMWTRNQNECTRQYPELHQIPIDGDVVLDGEVCSINPETGQIDFELVMERFQLKKKDKIASHSLQNPVHYLIWDILFHNGRDLRSLPLMKRRSILEIVLDQNERFSLVPQIEGNGVALYHSIVERSMEGIVAKRKDSLYVSRRSSDWLKLVNYQYADVYIGGYRKDEFGWLAYVEEEGKKRLAGIIELGVGPKYKKAFIEVSKQLEIEEDKKFVYLEPRLKAKVKYRNWTRHGMLRSPSFVEFII
ncbi:ATP-dependent DNA ligase [Paenibacillus sp. GD4]|uniref:ATP-dependent DNA ligase n=1 Tax=Paenibacillus sp. GD4 TaxID=3068890 RepID=UPI00279654C8|nr:ATP-dependent DNA ligase [Paenibacillus sp. GD4]MDQ1913240.1 ATP-dependent DNA ligase [Paenibacillus sp. GD4]